jgi:hypothetical protein
LKNLTIFRLVSQPISDLKPLANCKKVKNITLEELDKLTNVNILAELPNLETLSIAGLGNVKQLDQTLAKLNTVTRLRLRKDQKNWKFIKILKSLKFLKCRPSADFSTIAQLKTLEHLELFLDPYGNELPSLDQFKNFQHLEKLDIRFFNTKRNISDDYLNQLRAMLPNTEVVVKGG